MFLFVTLLLNFYWSNLSFTVAWFSCCCDRINTALLYLVVCIQLKVVIVPAENKPHLVMVASRPIDVGEEMLFDYNDRQSTMSFLKKCLVCDDQQEATAASTSQPAAEPSSQSRQPEPSTKTHRDTGIVHLLQYCRLGIYLSDVTSTVFVVFYCLWLCEYTTLFSWLWLCYFTALYSCVEL